MKSEQITVRLEQDILEFLKDEAKKRKQPIATLVRTFIWDGAARYNTLSEELRQADERIEKRLLTIEALVGANLHVALEKIVLAIKQVTDEPHDAYIERLKESYRKSCFTSLEKGTLISAAIKNGQKS